MNLLQLNLCKNGKEAYEKAGEILSDIEKNPDKIDELAKYIKNSESKWKTALLGRMSDEDFQLKPDIANAIGHLILEKSEDVKRLALMALFFGGANGKKVIDEYFDDILKDTSLVEFFKFLLKGLGGDS